MSEGVSEQKGVKPTQSSYKITPKLHQSIDGFAKHSKFITSGGI